MQVRNGQVRNGQVRTGQVRTGQVRTDQVRTGQLRTGQVGICQFSTGNVKVTSQDMSRSSQIDKVKSGQVKSM